MCSARNKSSVLFAFLHRWLQLQEQTQFGTIPFSPNAMHCTYLLTASFLSHLLFIEKKFPLIYYQVPGRQIDSTSFNISSDLQLSNDKPHQCHCPGYLTAKMKIQKHKSHADKKNRPICPTHPLLLHKAPKAHFVRHTNQN